MRFDQLKRLSKFLLVSLIVTFHGVSGGFAADDRCQSTEFPAAKSEIAFISNRDGLQQIYAMSADGNSVTQLTHFNRGGLADLAWSPDGRYIAFTHRGAIYVLDVQSRQIRLITSKDWMSSSPAWSPDGTQLAYTSTRDEGLDVWVSDLDGGNARNLTYDYAMDMVVEWIPKSHRISYVPNSGANLQVWWLNGSHRLRLFDRIWTGVLYSVTDFHWSPDSTRLALQTDYGAYIVNADGTDLQSIEGRPTYGGGDAPSWSPDGCQLVFTSRRDGNMEIYTQNLTTGVQSRLTHNAYEDFGPVWRPTVKVTELLTQS